MAPTVLTDRSSHQQLSQGSPIIAIEFWSFRCEGCRNVAPIVSRMAQELADRVDVYKVNVDENPRLTAQYAVPYVPYLVIAREGQTVASFGEAWTVDDVKQIVDGEI